MAIRKKCIACGYVDDKVEVKRKANSMLNSFPKDIVDELKNIFEQINKNIYNGKIPEEYIFRFIYAIYVCGNDNIRSGIRTWNAYKYGKQGMSLKYLQAIIKSNYEERSSKLKAERKMRGHNPPDLDNPKKKASKFALSLTPRRRKSPF